MSISDIEPGNGGGSNFLYAARLVEMKREGNTVYARTMRRGEEDTGKGIHFDSGRRLVIPKGEMVIDCRDVDEYHNPVGLGDYRPIANTSGHGASSRRSDWTSSFSSSRLHGGQMPRIRFGRPLSGHATRHAKDRAAYRLGKRTSRRWRRQRCLSSPWDRMVERLVKEFCPGLSVPDGVAETRDAVKAMRDAFEHIDERAEGKVKINELHPEALTIFNQPDFVASSMLRYRQDQLNFESQVIRALVDCRELIMDAIDARATQRG